MFPIVGIGASAGGLSAFEELLNALPYDSGVGFVLVPHLAPQYKSHLAAILARNAKLPVSEIRDGDRVFPDHIYILPPNRALTIQNGVLRTSLFRGKASRHNPIDSFFRSLSADQGKKAVGVLLSGEGSDGTDGLRAVRERGGATFAQNRDTAAHSAMPHSAIAAGYVDFVLSPREIGERLGSAWKQGYRDKDKKISRSGGEDVLDRILGVLRVAKGVDFGLYKRSTVRRRILRRMALREIASADKYLQVLNTEKREIAQLYEDILIHVTSFFREPAAFKDLKSIIYPRILKNRSPDAPIRIWVPGCSTGEEAYSHAINLVEFLGKQAAHVPFQIFATDVNPGVIEKARLGLYPQKIKAEVSGDRLRNFFTATKDGYRIVPFIREHCLFAAKNLLQDPPFINLDLISCRNLLIYLGPELQEKALRIFQYAAKSRGLLMLGRSEGIGDCQGYFSPLDVKRKIFFERSASTNAPLDLGKLAHFSETVHIIKNGNRNGLGHSAFSMDTGTFQDELDEVLPSRYIPNGVIVNAGLDILRFLGNTSAYLHPAPGKPSINLRRMASRDLLLEIRSAILVTKKSGDAVRREIALPHSIGPAKRILIEVLPIKASNLHKEYSLVLFEDVASPKLEKHAAVPVRKGRESRRVVELKEDLAVSAEHLKAIIEEQESTNASLSVSNEELLSSNEELQSLNEEFETSREELQSTNEELITSNEEVERTNLTLAQANNDLCNLLANINIPIVLLGPELDVRRFTPPAEKVLRLSAEHVGRSICEVQSLMRFPGLKQRLLAVIKTGRVQEFEVQTQEGHWYLLFIRPYRVEKSKIEGVVLGLIDIHERKLSEKILQRLATVVRDSNDAVIIYDLKGRITAWNKSAGKMYGYVQGEALGMNIRKLMPGNMRINARELFRISAAPIQTRRLTKSGRTLDVLLTVTVLRDDFGKLVEVATTERDITDQKQRERELRSLHARVISAQETERKRLARELHDGIGQILSGSKFMLESLPANIATNAKDAAKIVKLGGLINRAISEIRHASDNLMPSELQDLGLEPALRKLCREFQERAGVHITLKTHQVPSHLLPELALGFFRIIQEALNNVVKHSSATRVDVSVCRKKAEIVLSVCDNGVGFALGRNRVATGRGIGIGNMRARAESLGGFMDLRSEPGAGTTLTVRSPLSTLGEKTT